MAIRRREFMVITAGAVLASVAQGSELTNESGRKMFGLIGKMVAKDGQRDNLIAILLEGVNDMPGCLSYIVAKDTSDPNGIWITEVWDSEASHKASLSLPAVRQAITRAKPLIASFSSSTMTEPVGGHGLAESRSITK